MKKTVEMFVAVLIVIFSLNPYSAHAVATEYKSEWSEAYVWSELSKYSPSDAITAGIMGYFFRESQMRSDAVAGWPSRNYAVGVTDICREFVEKIDAGLKDGSTKDEFIEKVHIYYGGFGLGQWSNEGYLEHFYDFVQENGSSIADAEVQCAFIFESMMLNERLWTEIQELDDPYRVGRRIGYLYDGTTQLGAETIASYAKMYYGRFHDTVSDLNLKCQIPVSKE